MRLGQLISSSFIVSCLMLCATGCVCVDRRGCSPYGSTCGGCPTGDCGGCNTCETGCDNGCNSCGRESYFGPGPFAKLLSHHRSSCGFGCASGCGGLYVDEWINERPQVDNCGCDECSTCGHQPVRSLFRLFLGDRFCGGCETSCCDQGVDFTKPLIYDGYDAHAGRPSRGCNCGAHSSSSSVIHGSTSEETVIETSESPSVVNPAPKAAPESKAPAGSTTRMTPTPAPPIPKSAMRLNPATRKVTR